MPVYREKEFLPYSLPCVYRLKPAEVLLLFDSVGDIETAKKIAKKFLYEKRTMFIDLTNKPSPEWKCRIAFARRYGFEKATYDKILNTDADTTLDPSIKNYTNKVGEKNIGLISFKRINYPIQLRQMISIPAQNLFPVGFTGLYTFYRPYWRETEDLEELKKLPSAEDTHLHLSMQKKYRVMFIRKVRNFHLRAIETKERHYLTGKMKYLVQQAPPWRVLAHSIIYLRPAVFSGYLAERLKDSEKIKLHTIRKAAT